MQFSFVAPKLWRIGPSEGGELTNYLAGLDAETLAAFAASFSALAATVSAGLAFFALRGQNRHQRLSVRPSLKISVSNYENHLAVALKNEGLGPAVIRQLRCQSPDHANATDNLIDLLPDIDRAWTTFMQVAPGSVIAAQDEAVLIAIDLNPNVETDRALIETLRAALGQIDIACRYTDFYGSKLPLAKRALTYFTTFKDA